MNGDTLGANDTNKMTSNKNHTHPLEGRFPSIRVSAIIINEKDEILLAKHRKKDREYWVLPGGHLEFGESLAQCVERELLEESGLKGKFERLVFVSESLAPNGTRHIINFFALLTASDGKMKIGSDEDILCEIVYVPLTKLPELIFYPNITNHIIQNHQEGWPNQYVQVLHTPWTN